MASFGNANVQQAVEGEVQKRMDKAKLDLAARYASGAGGIISTGDIEGGPTGAAYKAEASVLQKEKAKVARARREAEAADQENVRQQRAEEDLEDEDDDADFELRQLREQRLKALRNEHKQKLENLGKGHGQYREIIQDEFLAEVTSSDRVLCHFYHKEFARCKVIDHHLQKLVQRHVETKFIKIDAEKAPFFVEKLIIRTMPTIVFFFDGVAKEKLIGFEGLADDMPEGKEDEWPTIKLARLMASKGIIDNSVIVDDEGIEAAAKARMDELRKYYHHYYYHHYYYHHYYYHRYYHHYHRYYHHCYHHCYHHYYHIHCHHDNHYYTIIDKLIAMSDLKSVPLMMMKMILI
jgi:thiol-disulfide isomerase/thioredoxin